MLTDRKVLWRRFIWGLCCLEWEEGRTNSDLRGSTLCGVYNHATQRTEIDDITTLKTHSSRSIVQTLQLAGTLCHELPPVSFCLEASCKEQEEQEKSCPARISGLKINLCLKTLKTVSKTKYKIGNYDRVDQWCNEVQNR